MRNSIIKSISRSITKTKFRIVKNSPKLLIIIGTIGTVTGTITACRATLKVNDIIDEAKENIEKINKIRKDPEFNDKYSEDDKKKDLINVYANTGIKLVKLYAPSVIIMGLSIGCNIKSNRILTDRYLSLTAAYAGLSEAFKKYRNEVKKRFGESIDQELKYGIQKVQVDKEVVDENGKRKIKKETVEVVVNPEGYSDYARFFDESSPNWEDSSEYNLMFLKSQQNIANDRLRANGILFLNDVYAALGIPKTKAGQVVGWIYDKEHPVGDNYVDFGIYDIKKSKARDFVNGFEESILLDFNVDGNVWELMK